MAETRRPYGRQFEDFALGDVYPHWPGRTITDHDETWFSLMTMNQNPGHIDAHFSSTGPFGKRIVNGVFVLACAVGMSVSDVTGDALAVLGYDAVKHLAPTFPGDTLYARTKVVSKRKSKSREKQGIVEVETEVFNQRDEVVMSFRRTVLVKCREQ